MDRVATVIVSREPAFVHPSDLIATPSARSNITYLSGGRMCKEVAQSTVSAAEVVHLLLVEGVLVSAWPYPWRMISLLTSTLFLPSPR